MLSAVNLYDYPALETDEVHKEGTDGLLATEPHASELATLELLPEALLRFGRIPPESSGTLGVCYPIVFITPIPAFPRQGGRRLVSGLRH